MTDLERDLAAGGKLAPNSDFAADIRAGGKDEESRDVGPEARRAMRGGPAERHQTDEEAGTFAGPLFVDRMHTRGGKNVVTEQNPKDRTEDPLSVDTGAQQALGYGLTAGALGLAGGGFGLLGKAIARTRGGELAKFLAERGEPLSEAPNPPGEAPRLDPEIEDEIKVLERLRERSTPAGKAKIDEDIARMRQGPQPDADVEAAQDALRFKGHIPHGPAGLARGALSSHTQLINPAFARLYIGALHAASKLGEAPGMGTAAATPAAEADPRLRAWMLSKELSDAR